MELFYLLLLYTVYKIGMQVLPTNWSCFSYLSPRLRVSTSPRLRFLVIPVHLVLLGRPIR